MLDGPLTIALAPGTPVVMREHCQQGFGADMDIRSLFGEKVEEPRFLGHKPLQKSWHDV